MYQFFFYELDKSSLIIHNQQERVKYAIRLRHYGGRTNNGDIGLNSVKGSDNTIFTFNTCSLSLNGTTQSRGQIPYILYYR